MAKSNYADRFTEGKTLLDEIRDEQIGRLGRAAQKDRESTLRDWADLAGAEAAVKEGYQGRFLFELLQNANDALVDAGVPTCELNARVRLELTPRSLLIANFGQPFAQANVRALCRLHDTTKSASKQIGHKGIGFKSVLEITRTPQVFSDIYAFTYNGDQFARDVGRVMGSGWRQDAALPTLRMPYTCFLNQINAEDRARVEALFDEGFVTVIRLPWEDEQTAAKVASRIHEDLQPSLLLFLTAIQRIEIMLPDGREECFRRATEPADNPALRRVLLYREQDEQSLEDSRWFVLGPIERPIADRRLVEDLDKAWREVNAVRFSLAFQLDRLTGRPLLRTDSQPFYVYFPTQEPSGLRFIVHADFHVGSDRKTLAPGKLNRWLMDEVCGYLAGEGVDALKQIWRQGPELIELLAPVNRPEREFSRAFMSSYLGWLRDSPFVPVDGGQYKEPSNVRFPPKAANEQRFRSLLPAARLRGTEKWAYAISQVIEAERDRKSPFLFGPELGAIEITAEQVIAALQQPENCPIEQCGELIALLAEWWDNLSAHSARPEFEKLVKKLPIFPTGQGWLRVDERTVFQANLRPGVADVAAPPGFDFAVIRRDAYPEAGSTSVQYRFFDKLGARNYAARDLIRDAILPVLTSVDRLSALAAEHPDSVVAAYRMVFQYYQDDGSSREMTDRLARVLLPAWGGSGQAPPQWRAACECYLGAAWPGGEQLETVFAGFDDCFFVRELPGLELADEQERAGWANFLAWLGVHIRPRLIAAQYPAYAGSTDPFGNRTLWRQYLKVRDQDWRCVTDARHGTSRTLVDVYALHHFSDIAAAADLLRLRVLFQLLAANWSIFYSRHSTATARCDRVRCQADSVENFFLFALRRVPWLPAILGSNSMLLAPHDMWELGETEQQDVRSLLPVLEPELIAPEARDFRTALRFISSGTAQIEDYLRLLGFLVEHYPKSAAPQEFEDRRRTRLTATFNWALEHIQTGLGERKEPPTCPPGLKLLAAVDGGLDYVARNDPRLVYGNDPFMEARWRPHCAFVRMNDDWQGLRTWLGIPNLTSVVRASWTEGSGCEMETQQLKRAVQEVLPFLAALVRKRQPTVYDRMLPRLKRLDVQVVDALTVSETIERLEAAPAINTPASVHLRLEDTRIRAGSLVCTAEVLRNPNLLGDHVAGYIEIAGLSDAFVLLMHLDPTGRQRYVEGKGVTSEMLQAARTDLSEEPEPPPLTVVNTIQDVITKAIDAATPPQPTGGGDATGGDHTGSQNGNGNGVGGGAGGGVVIHHTTQYQALDTAAAVPAVPASERAASARHPSPATGAGGGGTTLTLISEETKGELGRRGEEWVYASEKRRLQALNLDAEELEKSGYLAWVSKDRPGSPYDIRSVDENLNDVYIEVKSSFDRNPVIHLSVSELAFAFEKGERYWLYWVGNASAAQPDVPEYYRNLGRYIADKKITLDVDSLKITLRPPA